MSKSSNKRKKGTRANSPLSAHRTQGTRVVPPMLAVPNLTFSIWAKDVLPDLLWLCVHLTEEPLRGLYRIAETLDAIDEALDGAGIELTSYGALTQFEGFPEEARAATLRLLEDRGIYDWAFPEGYAHALGMYAEAPGNWLIEPWLRRGLIIDPQLAEEYLRRVIAECAHGQSLVPTRAKFLYIRGMVKAGKLHFPSTSDTPELLSRYPERLTEDERSHTEPSIRAAFLMAIDTDSVASDIRVAWCQRFWRTNWKLYECVRPEPPPPPPSGDSGDRSQIVAAFEHFSRESTKLCDQVEHTSTQVDPDLYDPDRYEVLTGIATRVIRLVEGASKTPTLWTEEHGASLMRSVIEAKIIIRWLEHKGDRSIYTRFKEYGRGRLKLLKLHVESYIDSLDEVPDELRIYLEQLDSEVNADVWEEYQEISIDKTFSGTTARQMAIDVGLKSDYDFVFAPASGTTHGDWAALDRHALTRCGNPLHLWHRIPNFEGSSLVDPVVMDTVLHMASDVVNEYVGALEAKGT